jgi:CBS domain-containing protein
MTIRRISEMVRHKNPVTLPQSADVCEACRQMRERRVGAVLVVDEEQHLVGIFTGRDAVALLAENRDAARTPLSEVMTKRPSTITSRQSAIDALHLMEDGGFRHVPIVDGGKVVSVVSRGDFRGLELARLDEETGYWERI